MSDFNSSEMRFCSFCVRLSELFCARRCWTFRIFTTMRANGFPFPSPALPEVFARIERVFQLLVERIEEGGGFFIGRGFLIGGVLRGLVGRFFSGFFCEFRGGFRCRLFGRIRGGLVVDAVLQFVIQALQ